MKKIIVLVIAMVILTQQPSTAKMDERPQESRELMFQDMLMLFLLPHINTKIAEIYSDILTESPLVYPYFVEVEQVQRVNGFRGFHFSITLDVIPVVGPHISVGEDRMTFDISPTNPDNVKLIGWKHIKGPQKGDLPPNWEHILKR